MKLPVTPEYLASALRDGFQSQDVRLVHHGLGQLMLPTGMLVACDPLVNPDTQSFNLSLPKGSFPVFLSVAHIKTDQRVAFAVVRFKSTQPVGWKMMTIGNQNIESLKEGHAFGYPVDSGTGCFMDRSSSRILEQPDVGELMIAELEKTYVNTWSWVNLNLQGVNIIAFSSGYGDGGYTTYAGYDSDGDLSVVVSDFDVFKIV
jgi:Protein of unknown function (DUF4241)